jgi:GxxExxY protein
VPPLSNFEQQLYHKKHEEDTKDTKKKNIMNENDLSNIIIGCAIEVHKQLGPGLLESAYRECLSYELTKAGLTVHKEKPMPVIYKEVKLDHGYRIDLLVENKVVVEIKTVESFTDVHTAQVLTYLRLGNYKLGLLLNFYVTTLKNGIKRVIN